MRGALLYQIGSYMITMRLIGKDKIQQLLRSDNAGSKWLRAWVAELANANWKHPDDVSKQFPNHRRSDDNSFIFPISNCSQEVCIKIAFQQNIAIITGLQ